MLYAYAAILDGIPFINGAPNLAVDVPALRDLAEHLNVPIAGKDFKTGQTWMKTLLAPGLKARGWTESMIRDLLGDPDAYADNPHYKSAAPRRLWRLQRVEAAAAG